jgi:predicted phage terminase large subunit-like protein
MVELRNVEDHFQTTQRGCRRSSSFAAGVTGFGFDGIIIDDAIKTDEALAKSHRDRINDNFASALYSRLDRKSDGFIIVVMQRTHDEDLAGFLLKQGGWDHLNLPAIAEQDEDIPIGNGQFYHRSKGEALNPSYESISSLEDTRRRMGSMHFQAQYQQAPIPEFGNLIKRQWIQYFNSLPSRESGRVVQSWDTAAKGNQINDHSVGTTWLCADRKHYLVDLVRRQCNFPTLSCLVLDQYNKHKPDALLIEDHGSSSALIQDLKHHHGINAIPIIPVGDKVTRLSIVSPRFEAGEIWLPKDADWIADLLDELLRFPQARFDDQVDSITQYLNWQRGQTDSIFDVFWP